MSRPRKCSPRNSKDIRHVSEHQDRPEKPKKVTRTYKVNPQTAYHVIRLATQEHKTEGQIIDKLMRTYLADIGEHAYKDLSHL